MPPQDEPLDLTPARQRLAAARSLEELADNEGLRELLENDFPRQAGGWMEGVSRRQFLKLMGASLALAGLTGCGASRPVEQILPYVRQPEEIIPGRPLYYATAMPMAGYGTGLLVESHEGRPTKVEGNPQHPTGEKPAGTPNVAEHGPADAFAQASVLGLYDPDRSQAVTNLGAISSWDAFTAELAARLRRDPETSIPSEMGASVLGASTIGLLGSPLGQGSLLAASRAASGLRLRILTETVTSPSLAHQIQAVLKRFPRAKWHVYEPAGRDNARLGALYAFGQDASVHYRFDQANVVLALDADFLSCGPGHQRYLRDFSARRQVRQSGPAANMNRLYVVESALTCTGAKADHRRPLRAVQVESFTRAVAVALGIEVPEATGSPAHGIPEAWIRALVDDLRLQANRGASVVIAGDSQPPLVHALVHEMNRRLGNLEPGRTVVVTAPVEARPPQPAETPPGVPLQSLLDLVNDMPDPERPNEPSHIDMLLILGGNPVYTAPADLRFAARMERIPFRVHLSLYEDETSEVCHWHIPEAHYLESWGDVRAYDGTASIVQPLIAPLYGGRTIYDVLSLLTGQAERTAYEVVRAYWRRFRPGPAPMASNTSDFEAWWRRALHDGIIAGSAAAERRVTALADDWTDAPGVPPIPSGAAGRFEIVFRPDPTVFDGRFANNGWLQELPKPISSLTWDNVALLSAATAVSLGLAAEESADAASEVNGQMVTLEYAGRTVEAPVWVAPGHPNDSVTVYLGYGRTRAGNVGTGVGFDAYRLRPSGKPWFGHGLTVTRLNRRDELARVQPHHNLNGRADEIVRAGTFDQDGRLSLPTRIPPAAHAPRTGPSLYPARDNTGHQWGMAIDLTLCTGCSACVVACQAENNIPVVGKDQVVRSRELHWLRIDSYQKGSHQEPALLQTFFQPLACVQCENAPCEVVCPVGATVHSRDGLNDMVYNRCVGTRYCSNNCPYKVRRFNFLQYSDWATEALRPMRNPDVTVRSRGVMEKCTYCVQRIRAKDIDAQRDGHSLRDGEIETACQAACPAGAIVFGDLNLQGSRVATLQAGPLNYGLLYDLNTRPRTTYLAAIRNPNPAIERLDRGAAQ